MDILKKRWQVIVILLLSIMIVIPAGFYIYTLDYYHALPIAVEALKSDEIEYEVEDKMTVFKPKANDKAKGIIFYPGGKVDYLAYGPLMKNLAKEGYSCFLMEMPFNLAVFDQEAASRPIDQYGEIESWYLAGHSLGGAMASLYADKHEDKIHGLILLGAYPAADLSLSNMSMLSIYGSEDKVLNKEKAEINKAFAPKNSSYFEIKGGNHAYFGSYGEQKKDGQADLSDKEQQEISLREILRFIED